MTIKLAVVENRELKPRLTVFGVGGAGGNAVNNMIARNLEGVDFVVANTDAQALALNNAPAKLQLGEMLTEGLGAGANPEIGQRAADESLEQIADHLKGAHMCFITAGMGGGTGTGAAPIIAQTAREYGILTVGVVTKPFQFEGRRRMRQAEEGIKELQQYVDTLIVIPNQNLFRLANEKTTFTEAFSMADDVLYQGVQGVTDLMVRPGMINLDFADIRAVMNEMGKAMMGTGEAEGEDRAIVAAERAIANPLLDEISLQGARGVLINITGGSDLALYEIDEAVSKIGEQVAEDANLIFGTTCDPSMDGRIRVSVVATGIDVEENFQPVASRRQKAEQAAPAAPQEDLFTHAEPADDFAASQPESFVEEPQVFEEEPVHEEVAAQAPSHAPAAVEAPAAYPTAYPAASEVAAPVAAQEEAAEYEYNERHAYQERVRAIKQGSVKEAPAAIAGDPRAPERQQRHSASGMIQKILGGARTEQPAVARRQPEQVERAEPCIGMAQATAPRQSEAQQERVDIPAFLRRQAN